MLAELFNLFFWGAFFSGVIGISTWFMCTVTPPRSKEEKEKMQKFARLTIKISSIIFLCSITFVLLILLIGVKYAS